MTIEEFLKSYGAFGISALALFVSYRGYRIARRTEKRTVAAVRPIVSATVRTVEDQSNWFTVELRIENRATFGYRGESVTLRSPQRAVGLNQSQAFGGIAYDPKLHNPLPIEAAKRTIPVWFEVSKAGVSGRLHPHSVDERHFETVYVHVPPQFLSDVIVMTVRLASLEGLEKNEDILVYRKLPGRHWYKRG